MAFTRTGTPNHDNIAGVSAADHHAATVASDLALADLATRAHADLSDAPADAHQARQHALSAAADHTGEITDAQHGARTIASGHLHSALASLGSPVTDHTAITGLEYARARLFGH